MAQQARIDRERKAYNERSTLGRIGQDVTEGFLQGADQLANVANKIYGGLGAIGGGEYEEPIPRLSPAAQEDLATRAQANNSLRSQVARGLGQAIPTLPAYVGAGALTGPAGVAGLSALQEDWKDPLESAANVVLNTAVPIGAGKLASAAARPLIQGISKPVGRLAANVAAEGIGGAAGNVGTALASGETAPQALTAQALIGAATSAPFGAKSVPEYQARRPRIATPNVEPVNTPALSPEAQLTRRAAQMSPPPARRVPQPKQTEVINLAERRAADLATARAIEDPATRQAVTNELQGIYGGPERALSDEAVAETAGLIPPRPRAGLQNRGALGQPNILNAGQGALEPSLPPRPTPPPIERPNIQGSAAPTPQSDPQLSAGMYGARRRPISTNQIGETGEPSVPQPRRSPIAPGSPEQMFASNEVLPDQVAPVEQAAPRRRPIQESTALARTAPAARPAPPPRQRPGYVEPPPQAKRPSQDRPGRPVTDVAPRRGMSVEEQQATIDRARPDQMDTYIKTIQNRMAALDDASPDWQTQKDLLDRAKARRGQMREEGKVGTAYERREGPIDYIPKAQRADDIVQPYPEQVRRVEERRQQKAARMAEQAPSEPVTPTAKAADAYATHQDFGPVTLTESQAGVPRGKVRVTDADGAEHIINKRGRNQRAIIQREAAPAPEAQAAIDKPVPETAERSVPQLRVPDNLRSKAVADSVENDTKVSVKDLGLESKFPGSLPGKTRQVNKSINIDDIALGREDLSRGRMLAVEQALAKGVDPKISQSKGVDAITVVEDPKNPGKYIVDQGGNHRIALMKLAGFKGEVPVRATERVGRSAPDKPQFVKDAEARLKDVASGKRAGSGTQALVDQAIVTGHQLYRAGISFAEWSAAVIKAAGEAVRPHLKAAWDQINDRVSVGELPRTRSDVENSPRFKRWFGESKIVDEQGRPKVMYHSTQADFDTFQNTADVGFHFGTQKAANDRAETPPYFKQYGTQKYRDKSSVLPVYLSIKNPLKVGDVFTASTDTLDRLVELGHIQRDDPNFAYIKDALRKGEIDSKKALQLRRAAMVQALEEQGYDGLEYTNMAEDPGSTSYVAFHPEQIKSATGNSGAFSSDTGTILGAGLGGLQSGFGRRRQQQPGPAPSKPTGPPSPLAARIMAKQAQPGAAKPAPPRSAGQRIKEEAISIVNLPRAIQSSVDISAPLRQGAILTLPPTQWGRAARAGVQMFQSFSTKQHERFTKDLNARPDAQVARDAGLYLASDSKKTGLAQKEEAFISKLADKIPIVRHSGQAYVGYLDALRASTFTKYKSVIDKANLPEAERAAAYKAAADWINTATGRGSLGKTIDEAMPALSTVLFSPRFLASRIQLLNPATYIKNASTPGKRAVLKQQLGDAVQFAGVVGATLALAKAAGAEVGTDPESPDFLKIKTPRATYDFLAGIQQPMRLFYRIGKDVARASQGQPAQRGQDTMSLLGRFGRSKLGPSPSFVVDMVSRKDFIGRPFKMDRAVVERITPLFLKDVVDAYRQEGLSGSASVLPGALGVGVQIKRDDQPSTGPTRRSDRRRSRRPSGS